MLLTLFATACSNQGSTPPQDPAAVLQALPPADPAQYDRIQDMKKWRNPYLIIRPDGVALLDSADSEEVLLKTDEVVPALARLPASNWAYGRVVAAGFAGRASNQDAIAIRRNKGIVGGELEGAHIAVRWLPSN